MLARFFIDRPVLAWVISIVIVLLGGISAGLLPIAQYPQVTPPTVRVTAIYLGANARVVADTVAVPIEQQVNGVENMLYMSSQSSNDGSYALDVTFELGTDINIAQVLVQNRVAIGIVVDDAIVVLENIERWLDKGLPVREATIRATTEITGPILAITLVLSSVFLPSAFLGGITGQFFRQFALTISASMIISAVNAMTMTPARAASIFAGRTPGQHGDQGQEALPWWLFGLLGGLATVWLLAPTLGAWLGLPSGEEGGEAAPGGLIATLRTWEIYLILFLTGAVAGGALGWFLIRPVNWVLGKFFRSFNWIFDRATNAYGRVVGWALRLSVIVLLVYAGLIGLTGLGFTRVPAGFIPSQDKGRRGGRPGAAAADHHDVVCLHPRRVPAGDRGGGRGRDAPYPRDGELRRHDRGDPIRHLPDAGLLLRGPVVQWPGIGHTRVGPCTRVAWRCPHRAHRPGWKSRSRRSRAIGRRGTNPGGGWPRGPSGADAVRGWLRRSP
jgi:multidrug efflux pump subunit AcrB